MRQLVVFNADQQHRLAARIPQMRARAARIGYVLDGTVAMLGGVLMGLTIFEARRGLHLVARFGSRMQHIVQSSVHISNELAERGASEPVLSMIVREAAELLEANYAAVGYAKSAGEPFAPWFAFGVPPAQREQIVGAPRPAGVLADVFTTPGRSASTTSPSIRAFAGSPTVIRRWDRSSAWPVVVASSRCSPP